MADSTAEETQSQDFEGVAFDPLAADPPAAPAMLTVADVAVEGGEEISQAGGQKLTLTGTFPVNTPLEVFLGPTGTDVDAPAYGGQGFGYRPQSADGTHLVVITPKLTPYKGPLQILVRIAE